jgi:Ser/Thr protein kinase RdoA (MazF antagonist)
LSSHHPFDALNPDLVIAAVESTGRVADLRILALNSYENRVYQIGMEEGPPIIAKFYRPDRWRDEQILEEHAFTLELAALDVPVVPPLVDASGRTLHTHEGFRFALFERRGGRSPELDNLDHLLILGRFIGRIHQVGAKRSFQTRRSIDVQSHARDSADYLLSHDFIPAGLRPAYASLAEDLIDRLQSHLAGCIKPKLIRIHGDCHMGNILWRDDMPHFVDFDDTMMGPAIQDLWMLLNGSRMERMAQLAELVEGYNEFADFHPHELNLVEPLRTLRLMHYSAWLARRWNDPAFPHSFPWFNTERYWSNHVLALREQLAALDEEPLVLFL